MAKECNIKILQKVNEDYTNWGIKDNSVYPSNRNLEKV